MIAQQYKERQEFFAEHAAELHQRYNLISYVRLGYFLGAALLVIWLVSSAMPSWVWWFMLPLIVVFIILAKWHQRIEKQRDYFRNLALINEREFKLVAEHIFSDFANGQEFVDYEHPYTSNLDIFGERSVFQYLNRTITLGGAKKLADWLKAPAPKAEILERQAAVTELKNHITWRHDFQAKGMDIKENKKDVEALLQWVDAPFTLINSRFIKILTYLLPALMGLAIIAVYIGWLSVLVPFSLWLLNSIFIKFTHRETTHIVNEVARKAPLLQIYHDLIQHIENEPFKSPRIQQLQARLTQGEQTAATAIQQLSSLGANLNVRSNLAAYLILNTLFLWELIFCLKLEFWKKNSQVKLKDWLSVLEEVEALNSLGTLNENNRDWILPTINDQYFSLNAKQTGHLLLNPKHRVSNNLHIKKSKKVILITGSNMAGKSTFARTIGVNIVLALAGSAVCAHEFSTSVVTIYTSMRNKDSLQENESSFYAELKGLKRVIEVVEAGEIPVFFLLDEILKGTNSQDRHQGSVALIKQLLRHNGVGLITTHDLALCEMAAQFPDAIENWCFEVAIEGDNMVFDYKIKQGACQSLNATKLMQQMGIEVGDSITN